MTQTFEPVFIGVTPGGSEWWARRPGSEAKMRESFDRLWAKFNAKQAARAETELPLDEQVKLAEKRYQKARRRVLDLKHKANSTAGRRKWRSTYDVPGYMEASERCRRARVALRKLERKAARLAEKGN